MLNAMPIPQLDRGNHLSYGYQWIAFGIMAPLGLGYFIWSEIRERRRLREEEAAMQTLDADAESLADAPTSSSSVNDEPGTDTATDAAPHAAALRNRSRYGDSKPDHYAKLKKRRRERY